MKRRITLSIALVVGLIVLLLSSSDSRVEAQNQMRPVADSSVIKLGQGQLLRLTVVSVDGELGGGIYGVRFRQTRYVKTDCTDGVCRYVVDSQTTSPTMLSAPNQSSKLDVMGNTIGPDGAVRVEVLSSNRNVRVNAHIIDATTGQVDSLIGLFIP
jgi:hypothetical protein